MARRAVLRMCLCILLLPGLGGAARAEPGEGSWIVHRPADIQSMPRGANRLANPGFESGSTGWSKYGDQYVIDSTVAHGGSKSVRIPPGKLSAAVQKITLNQATARPLYFSGWSKASGVEDKCRMQYSLYLDITYSDGSTAIAPYVCYSGGTHDWAYVDKVVIPEKAVAWVQIWTMLSASSPGTAWFDDLAVGEYSGDIRTFDDAQILYGAPEAKPWQGAEVLTLGSGDGLTLGLTANGGAVASLISNGQEQVDTANVYASGFYVRDFAADGDYIHLGGTVTRSGSDLVYTASDSTLGLELQATFHSMGSHILIDASLRDATGQDRAVSLYFALPLAPEGRVWGKDIRSSKAATEATEHRFALKTEWGANGYMSQYCLADLSGPAGLTLAYPMDHPVVSRFSYNSQTHQYYVVCELGLTGETRPNPSRADVQLLLYQHDPAWGFRSAFDKYLHIYPEFFVKRAAEEGIWVAHANLDAIPNIADFGIKYHETGNASVYAYDDSINSYTLRYLTEPWGYWLHLPDDVSNTDYAAVMAYVESMRSSTTQATRRWGDAIMSSGIFDAKGNYAFEGSDQGFAAHVAAMILDADPDLSIAGYASTKAKQGWSVSRQEPYSHPEWGILDGEYIDSFESRGLSSNFRREHFAFSNLPLTFHTATKRVVLPHIFSSYEFAKWVAGDIHGLGKYMMANSVLLRWAFPAHLFDILGVEREWTVDGRFTPDLDSQLNLWRTFSYHKPYGLLQCGDLNNWDQAMTEQYFQFCAFYGIYPSFFTPDGGTTNYWEQSEWYERDRALFAAYIPKIVSLSQAGWEPLTRAITNNAKVYIERYGGASRFYLTLRNSSSDDSDVVVQVDLGALGLPTTGSYVVEEWLKGDAVSAQNADGVLSASLPIPAKSTRILRVSLSSGEVTQVPLKKGWNLVSLPGNPNSTLVADLLAPVREQVDLLYGYDAAGQSWVVCNTAVSYACEMERVEAGQGLWMHALADVAWPVSCEAPSAATISLVAGWNLVGYPLAAAQEIGEAVAPLGERLKAVYAYEAADATQPWRIYTPGGLANTLMTLQPGKGYWVQVDGACSWTLQAAP
jgi:hypothetical protein